MEISLDLNCLEGDFNLLGATHNNNYYFCFKTQRHASPVKRVNYLFSPQKELQDIILIDSFGQAQIVYDEKERLECFEFFGRMREKYKTKILLKGIDSDGFTYR